MTVLGDLVTLQGGGTPPRDEPRYWNGTIPWASVKDLSVSRLVSTVEYISPAGVEASATRIIKAGHVVVATRMAVGRASILEVDAAINQDLKALIPRPGRRVHPNYLLHLFGSSTAFLEKRATGATVKGIRSEVLENLPVPHANYDEQRRIADILDKADAIRRKRKEVIALTEEFLRSAFLEMFGDPVTNPKAWPVTTLGDEASQMKYGTSEKCGTESPGALPVLRIPNVVGEEIDWDDLKYANLDSGEVEGLRLRSGDLLFVRSNGNPDYIGRCAVYNSERIALFASYLIRVRLNAERLHPTYVRAALSSASYRARLASEARTTAGNYNISTEGLRRLRLPLPPMAMQVRFAELDAATRQSRERLKLAEHHAERVFSALVQQAFTTGDRLSC